MLHVSCYPCVARTLHTFIDILFTLFSRHCLYYNKSLMFLVRFCHDDAKVVVFDQSDHLTRHRRIGPVQWSSVCSGNRGCH